MRIDILLPPMDEFAQTLERCLRHQLPLLPGTGTVDLSVDLFEFGLDSMSAIALLLELEDAYGIRFPDQMLDPEVFRTGDTLLAAIRTLVAEQSASTAPGVT